MSDDAFPPRSPAARVRRLGIVVPVYFSERTIGPLVDRCVAVLGPKYESLEIVLVNDGSRDGSDAACREAVRRHPDVVRYILLARNFGEHNAVMCGLRHSDADAVAIIDDDFQNPPEEIVRLVEKLERGYDCVYSRYEDKRHHWFRNLGSNFNDRVATWLLKKPPGLYLSSFKVVNRFLVGEIARYSGPYPYVDGLVLRATQSIGVETCRHEARSDGRSNYTLRRLLRLWLNMFTGFSIVPLRFATVLGLVVSAAGLGLAAWAITARLTGTVFLHQDIPPGWASTIVALTVFSGVQLCVLGMIGEYLGRVFMTQNQGPQWVVRDRVGRGGGGGADGSRGT